MRRTRRQQSEIDLPCTGDPELSVDSYFATNDAKYATYGVMEIDMSPTGCSISKKLYASCVFWGLKSWLAAKTLALIGNAVNLAYDKKAAKYRKYFPFASPLKKGTISLYGHAWKLPPSFPIAYQEKVATELTTLFFEIYKPATVKKEGKEFFQLEQEVFMYIMKQLRESAKTLPAEMWTETMGAFIEHA